MMISDIKMIFDFIASIATVLVLLWQFLNWFFDYKISQWEAKKQKENRCTSRKGKQR